jgi:hypothetical protein
LVVDPGLLHGVQAALVGQAFDGDDLLPRRTRDRVTTRAHRLTIEQDGARATLGYAATELGAFDVEFIAQCPQQGHFRFDIQGVGFAIDAYFHGGCLRGEIFAF